ncbi:MAG: protein translocase subunit SecF, partial [Gemmatimonadetes bacterium]|nr:protein translocase subunit SecF [Gemmatimonadota bacterium]
RGALGGASAPPVTRFGADNEYVVRAPIAEGSDDVDAVAAGIESQLSATFDTATFEIVRREAVGAKIGDELERKAILAILFSMALTLLYIAFRFEFRFGVASVIATAHDVLIVLGLLALFRVEISLPTVAAILTILGYSLNDTIVVFDRIRENLNAKGGRKEDPYRLVNRSINETLPRTVLTSGTTLAVLFSLLVLGGAVIRDFTIVLILGVAIGTYSSIFIASPALLEIQKRYGTGEDKDKRRRPAAAAAM